MIIVDNQITQEQWESILEAFHTHCKEKGVEEDEIRITNTFSSNASGSSTSRKQSIHDNHERFTSPGLEFILFNDMKFGALFVYSGNEQAHAPITFEEGMEIAKQFFSEEASELSAHIVCNYVMKRVWS